MRLDFTVVFLTSEIKGQLDYKDKKLRFRAQNYAIVNFSNFQLVGNRKKSRPKSVIIHKLHPGIMSFNYAKFVVETLKIIQLSCIYTGN